MPRVKIGVQVRVLQTCRLREAQLIWITGHPAMASVRQAAVPAFRQTWAAASRGGLIAAITLPLLAGFHHLWTEAQPSIIGTVGCARAAQAEIAVNYCSTEACSRADQDTCRQAPTCRLQLCWAMHSGGTARPQPRWPSV